jgi:hypothetical protein
MPNKLGSGEGITYGDTFARRDRPADGQHQWHGKKGAGGKGDEREAVAFCLVVHPAGEHRTEEPAEGGDRKRETLNGAEGL